MYVINRICRKPGAFSSTYWNGDRWVIDYLSARKYKSVASATGVCTRKKFRNRFQVEYVIMR